jgi:hypothetical protein
MPEDFKHRHDCFVIIFVSLKWKQESGRGELKLQLSTVGALPITRLQNNYIKRMQNYAQ